MTTERLGRRTKPKTATVPYTGPMRPDIQTLLDNYRNLYPALEDETFERLQRNYLANSTPTSMIVLSARGNLVDGYHRCLILLQSGRKALTEEDYRIDYTAVDELSEIKAHVGYQEDRRGKRSADQAAMARGIMRRFGWSAGKFAEEFGFQQGTVKKWLARNPDAEWDQEMAEIGRIGKDGKVYSNVPGTEQEEEIEEVEPPKAKRIREHVKSGQAVVRDVNKYLAELTNPEWAEWVLTNIDADDREGVALKLDNIARATGGLAESLRGHDGPDSGQSF